MTLEAAPPVGGRGCCFELLKPAAEGGPPGVSREGTLVARITVRVAFEQLTLHEDPAGPIRAIVSARG